MPLHPGHSDEVRSKNIEEMMSAGHPPEVAKAAAYANQRKYRKMAEGGQIEAEMSEPHMGIYELQEDSNPEGIPSEIPVNDEMVAQALAKKEDGYAMGGEVSSDISPESHFAEEAKKAIEKRKKKAIQP